MGKIILITGAATGFGRGIALGLAARGHNVIMVRREQAEVWNVQV